MSGHRSIKHTGIIVGIGEGFVDVSVESATACGGCHANEVCGVSDSQEKIITAPLMDCYLYKVGDRVEVSISKTMGMMAVLLAYVVPFVVMFATLLIMIQAGISELISALTALGVVIAWYIVLALFRDKLDKEIMFKVEKCDD